MAQVDGMTGIWENYDVSGNELTRKNKFSPKAGKGHFMAEHKDRRTCGKTGYTEFKNQDSGSDADDE